MMNIEQFRTEQIEPLRQASLSRPHPNFFIVGAAKSGTTSLWAYLKQHPEIAVPSEHKYKEPSFFSAHYRFRPDIETYLGFEGALGDGTAGEPVVGIPDAGAAHDHG